MARKKTSRNPSLIDVTRLTRTVSGTITYVEGHTINARGQERIVQIESLLVRIETTGPVKEITFPKIVPLRRGDFIRAYVVPLHYLGETSNKPREAREPYEPPQSIYKRRKLRETEDATGIDVLAGGDLVARFTYNETPPRNKFLIKE